MRVFAIDEIAVLSVMAVHPAETRPMSCNTGKLAILDAFPVLFSPDNLVHTAILWTKKEDRSSRLSLLVSLVQAGAKLFLSNATFAITLVLSPAGSFRSSLQNLNIFFDASDSWLSFQNRKLPLT